MEQMNRKRLTVLCVSLLLVGVLAGAFAAVIFTRTLQHTVTLTTSRTIQFYSEEECINPVATVDWGSINVDGGTSYANETLWLKNEANVVNYVYYSVSGLSSSDAELLLWIWHGGNAYDWQVGTSDMASFQPFETLQVTFGLTPAATATIGALSWSQNFYACDSISG
jgi:hypothetical protein